MDIDTLVTTGVLEAAFLAATETDDLDLVQTHFEPRDVQNELAVWNAVLRARRLDEDSDSIDPIDPIRSWYERTRDSEYELIWNLVDGHRVAMLQWFLAREQLALLGETLRDIAIRLLRTCTDFEVAFELAEMVIESPLFQDVLEDHEQRRVLGSTLFHAASFGRTRWCELLLAYGADRTVVPDSMSLLKMLVYDGNDATLDLLIDNGAWIVGEPLPELAYYDTCEYIVCSAIRRGADAHAVSTAHGRTVLHNSVRSCLAEIVASLLQDGVMDVDVLDADGCTPLLVVGGADLDGFSGASPQHVVVQLLLDAGADIHAVDAQQQGVLHRVVQNGDAACTQLLLARGADPSAVDDAGRTPIFTALSYPIAVGEIVEMLTLLVQAGADPFRGDYTTPSTEELLDSSELGRLFMLANSSVFYPDPRHTAAERQSFCTLL